MKVSATLITRCFDIVELLADARELPLGEISETLDLPKSGAHRLLTQLAQDGWVEQNAATGFYRLTLRLAILGQRFLLATRIPDICQPVLDRVARESRELVRMAVVDGDGLTWLSYAQGAQAGLMYHPNAIAAVPLHATANGKAWLATLSNEEAVKKVLRAGFGRPGDFGPKAVRTVEGLIHELAETRSRGWGLAVEEGEPGVAAVAVAIRLQGDAVVGTVSIAGPLLRMGEDRLPEMVELIQGAAADLATLWPLRSLRPQQAVAVVPELAGRS